MGIFGPHAHYPPPLQMAVDHAERFSAMLCEIGIRQCPATAEARAWLTGRDQEVEAAVTDVLSDWSSGRLETDAAERAISSYLRAAHAGARRHLGLGEIPPCCLADVETTRAVGTHDDSATTVRIDRRASPENDTLVDPPSMVADEEDGEP